jgi:hypothetical protein
MRVSSSISIRRDRIRALLSLPRLALRAEKFQESSIWTLCAVNVVKRNGTPAQRSNHICNVLVVGSHNVYLGTCGAHRIKFIKFLKNGMAMCVTNT